MVDASFWLGGFDLPSAVDQEETFTLPNLEFRQRQLTDLQAAVQDFLPVGGSSAKAVLTAEPEFGRYLPTSCHSASVA